MIDLGPVLARTAGLRGMTAHRIRVREDGVLTFSLSRPPDDHRWIVWIYSPAWRVESADRVLASARALNGRRLRGTDIEPPSLDTTFRFSTYALRVFPVTAREDSHAWPQWSLRSPDGEVWDIGPGSEWSVR
ncbi:hypothetical protein KIPE111705_27980 [Kibdelosporangium persicum]|uniref:Uncharacterized protein n=1 Tax=Kibdelosporangium persicum TaxID=2698649 RepID=A0ABX2FGF2_9PSEU|nr:hypothetical protein [Kibdelosporangium persicum]NRN70308.1 hypothetical protein [Kibdelosporangium persicum]